MKYLKYLESIFDTKLEISNIINDCRDIMLELKDMGVEIEVKKDLINDSDLIIACYINVCNRTLYFKIREEISETLERLEKFMELKKFKLYDIYKEGRIGYFVLVFKKDNIDKDYIGHLRYLKRYNIKEKYSSNWKPEEILNELSIELRNNGLYVNYRNDNKFGGKFYLEINDKDKLYCKNYPIDELDWLWGKKIIIDFLTELDDFGFIRDVDYRIYGGGTSVNIVFDDKKRIKL